MFYSGAYSRYVVFSLEKNVANKNTFIVLYVDSFTFLIQTQICERKYFLYSHISLAKMTYETRNALMFAGNLCACNCRHAWWPSHRRPYHYHRQFNILPPINIRLDKAVSGAFRTTLLKIFREMTLIKVRISPTPPDADQTSQTNIDDHKCEIPGYTHKSTRSELTFW